MVPSRLKERIKHIGTNDKPTFLSTFKENLALNRRTWQEFPWQDTNLDVGSENAVDGLYFDRGTGGQCTISADYKLNATWYVDLGSVLSISHVDIYYRTDNKPSLFFFKYNMTSKTYYNAYISMFYVLVK